jgi:hypothetical protein
MNGFTCEALLRNKAKQRETKAKQRNAEPALKGWFSGFGKHSTHVRAMAAFPRLKVKIPI